MAALVSWASEAWLAIQAIHPQWGFLWSQTSFNTANGTTSYLPAADFNEIDINRVYCDGTWMLYIPFEDAREQMYQSTTGKPTHFTLLPNKRFRPFPTPDAVYAISFDYWTVPVTLAANSDTPAVDADLHNIIVWRAVLNHASFFGEPDRIAFAQAEYNQMMSVMNSRYLPKPTLGEPLV